MNYYCLLNVANNGSTGSLTSKYKMTIRIFNSSKLTTDESYKYLIDEFKNLFKFSNYNETGNIPFTILNIDYVDINTLEYFNEGKLDSNSAITCEIQGYLACALSNIGKE